MGSSYGTRGGMLNTVFVPIWFCVITSCAHLAPPSTRPRSWIVRDKHARLAQISDDGLFGILISHSSLHACEVLLLTMNVPTMAQSVFLRSFLQFSLLRMPARSQWSCLLPCTY